MSQFAKSKVKTIFTGLLCLVVFSGCSALFDPAALLKGNLNAVYLNAPTDEYAKMVEQTVPELNAQYEEGLVVEAEYFANYFDINLELCSEDIQPQIVEMYRKIYNRSKYEVGDTTKNGDTYLVSLTISPIDIMQKVMEEDVDIFMENWQSRLDSGEFDAVSDEEFETAWAQGVIDMVSPRLDSIGYLEDEKISVQIAEDSEGYYTISQNDWERIDELIISY